MAFTDQSFDESVRRALEKWPNVPNCFGWVSLNRRGQWLIKDELITHKRAVEFIARNYASDEHGRWFVQNGPQRVFCDLEYTPLVFRLNIDRTISSHTGVKCKAISAVILDDDGNLLINTNLGIGILDDRDLIAFCDLAIIQAVNGKDELDKTDWFDFDRVREENLSAVNTEISFAGNAFPLIAEYANQIAQKYGFAQNPQPRDQET